MKIRSVWVVAVCAILALSGCIDSRTKITVKTDGSGTIEKTIVLSKVFVEFMQGMGMKGDSSTIEGSMLNDNGLKAGAAQLGAGVTFVSAEKITTEKGNGYKAIYNFTDITKVKVSQNPATDVTMPSAGASTQPTAPELYTFSFTPGSPATLTIVAPKVAQSSSSTAPAQTQQNAAEAEQMMATLKPLYADLRIMVSVEVKGKITQTNAAFVDGSTVTLIDMDFGKIFADEGALKKLMGTQTQSVREVQEMVKNVPGIKMDMQPSVSVKFQ